MNKWMELLTGMIFLIGAIVLVGLTWGINNSFWDFGNAAWEFLKGGIVWFIAMIGILFILLGISDLKE